jgi:hypothetical protein
MDCCSESAAGYPKTKTAKAKGSKWSCGEKEKGRERKEKKGEIGFNVKRGKVR